MGDYGYDEEPDYSQYQDQYANEGYTTCDQGHQHWGVGGAAGLMLHHQDENGTHRYLMQQRSPWVDHGGTWAPPSGALNVGEHPVQGALREAQEELGPFQSGNHQVAHTNDHGGWAFHTVTGDVAHQFDPELDDESSDAAWLTPEEIDEMPLHPGFRESWNDLRPQPKQKFAMAADPHWLDNWMERNGPYAWHRTKPEYLESIQQKGLIPWDHPEGAGSGYSGYLTPRPDHVYLREEPESIRNPKPPENPDPWDDYNQPPVGFAGRPNFLRVDLRKLSPESMNPDEDQLVGEYNRFGIPIPPSPQENGGDWYEKHDASDPSQTAWSMEGMGVGVGTMAHRGIIPPEAIDYPYGQQQRMAKAEPDELHVAYHIPEHIRDTIHGWAKDQDWPEGTELEDPSEYHITVLYTPGGRAEHKDDDWIHEHKGRVDAEVAGLDNFTQTQDGSVAHVLRIHSDEAKRHAEAMQDEAEKKGLEITHFDGGYKPHLTIGYGEKKADFEPPKIRFKTEEMKVSEPRAKESAWHFGSTAPQPPNLRESTGPKHCGNCKMFDAGKCWGYGNVKVGNDDVCDSWFPEAKKAAVSAPNLPALYHWTDVSDLHNWMDPAHTGPGDTYLTEHGDAPDESSWNPDVPTMRNPVRLTIDHSQLDPSGWDEGYNGWLNNYLYHGVIPPEAISDVKAFPAPDTWDQPEHWAKTASMQWQPGIWGKGVVYNGETHTWPEDWGSHDQYLRNVLKARYADPAFANAQRFHIRPDGTVNGATQLVSSPLSNEEIQTRIGATKFVPPLPENEGKSTEPQEVCNPWDAWPEWGERTNDQQTHEVQIGDSSTATV